MTFRATPLRPDETLTVNTPEANRLVEHYCIGTTWSGTARRHVDVLWLGERLALLKIKFTPVEYRVVARASPRDTSGTFRAVIRALSRGEHGKDGKPDSTIAFPVSHDSRIRPRLLSTWIEALKLADTCFDAMAKELGDRAKIAAGEAKAKALAAAIAAESHARAAAGALTDTSQREVTLVTPHDPPEAWARVELREPGAEKKNLPARIIILFAPHGLVSIQANAGAGGPPVVGGEGSDLGRALVFLARAAGL